MRIKRARQILKSFADDTRLRIINLLHKQELTVSDLCRVLHKQQPSMSKHLTRLRLTGVVGDRRQGLNVYYHLIRSDNKTHRELLSVITYGLVGLETFKKDLETLKKLRKRRP
ncbi:ArsR/SmtB family transcription factor [Candidatus Omnitrophota bacterium]